MAHGGSSLAPMDPELVDQEVLDIVKQKEQDITSGELEVEIDDSEPKSTL